MEVSDIVWEVRKNAITSMIKSGKRSDGRSWDKYRKLELIENYVTSAQGSCLVKLGETQVLVGVKLGMGKPYPDSPNMGNLSTSCELSPLASPDFEAGPPRPESIEIARVVDRGLRESKMIDFEKLCVKEGEESWTVFVDIHILNQAGNIIDAASLAAVKALRSAYIPKYEDEKILYAEKDKPLPVNEKPISSTFAKIDGSNLLDPVIEEEKVMESRLTIVTTEKGNICAMQKSGVGSYPKEEIEKLVETAIKQGKEIRKQF